jgi:hypothetical protein
MMKLIAAMIVAVGLVGCASVPLGDVKLDEAAKTFAVKGDKAGIYVYRNESLGAALKFDLSLDGKNLGQTAAKTYFYQEVAPGKHTLTSKAENTDTLELDTMAGKLYYVWQEVKLGVLTARNKLSLVSEEEGKKGVLESKLIAEQK